MNALLKNYQIVLDSIEDGVFTVNKDWEIMTFNKGAENITGVSRKKAIGKQCQHIFRSTLCQDGCVLKKTMVTGAPLSNIPVCISPSMQRELHISVNTAMLRDTNEKVIGGVEVFRDLSTILKLKEKYKKLNTFENIVSKNEKMQKYFSILPQVADSNSTILLEGATGTGKELFARAIHNASSRKKGPFVAVNCSAMPDTLIESELFGYKAGAFTDAKKDKLGRFARAENGTLFLDEIGDISPAIQVRLLRVLQEKQYDPLGSSKSEKTNARIIVATNKNLEQLVAENVFREDLYYRINIVKFSLPPLLDRKEDIPYLVDHFVNRYNFLNEKSILGLSQESIAVFMSHGWPGNIRELENTIEHAFILCQGELILPEHLPDRILPVTEKLSFSSNVTLEDIEKTAIIQALNRNKWKKMLTAKELGINKNTLRRKIIRLGIEPQIDLQKCAV